MNESSVKLRIVDRARARFFQLGFRKVTVDELAREIGVSKKTIYKWFPSKDELLLQVLKGKIERVEQGLHQISRRSRADFVDSLKEMLAFLASQLAEIREPFLHDMKRNTPHIWKEVEERRNRVVLKRFGELFRQGMKHRAFRKDIHLPLLVLMHATLIQRIVNPETLSQLSMAPAQAVEEIFKVILEGVLSDKARVRYQSRGPKTAGRTSEELGMEPL